MAEADRAVTRGRMPEWRLRFLRSLFVAGVFVLIGGWIVTRWLVHQAEQEFPVLGEFVEADGIDLHYVEKGSGAPVVLLHGVFGGVQDYVATVFDSLAAESRTIAIDRPGSGYSERGPEVGTPAAQARRIHAALGQLEITNPVLVGFSWGGATALAYADQFPEDVAALVVINGATHEWPGGTSFIYRVPSLPVIGPLVTHTWFAPLTSLIAPTRIERAFDPLPVTEHFRHSPLALSFRPHSFAANCEDLWILEDCLREQSQRYSSIQVPTQIVVAEGDQVAGPKFHSHRLHEELPNSELTTVPNAGHQLLYTHPEVVLAAIGRAFREAAKARGAAD